MNSFKIDIIKQQPLIPNPPPSKPPTKLTINIQSIVCLNYPIEILSQVINSHFDEQPCPANLVIKALKIISISLKDNQLKANIQKILQNNIHKRQRVYILISYWCTIAQNISSILQKFDIKLLQSILGAVISQYCFTSTQINPTISKMISLHFDNLTCQSKAKIGQVVKNQYVSSGCPFSQLMKSVKKVNLKNQQCLHFFRQIAQSIMKIKQTQQQLNEIFVNYFRNSQIRTIVDQYFTVFTNLITYFIQGVRAKLKKQEVFNIWFNVKKYPMEQSIKSSIKQWINKKPNYWQLFAQTYSLLTKQNKISQLKSLLQLGTQLQQQNLLHSYIIKQYLYSYLSSKTKINKQAIVGGQIWGSDKGSNRYIWNAVDLINELAKSTKNILNDGVINLILINKIHAPSNWPKTDQRTLKTSTSHKSLQPFIQKLATLSQTLQKKCKQKGQIIQLAFHGIIVHVKNQPQNGYTEITVTFHQLVSILKQAKLPANPTITSQYHPSLPPISKPQTKKQTQSVLLQAKIVRILKRSNKKLNFNQIYQATQQFSVPEQSCKIAINKIISKGIISEDSQGYYTYCP